MLLIISLASLALALYMMKMEIYICLCKLFGYTIVGEGFKHKHYCITRAEALEWLGCYDNATIYKGRRLYSEKRTLKA
jgi:hypothetical protein